MFPLFNSVLMLTELDSVVEKDLKVYVKYKREQNFVTGTFVLQGSLKHRFFYSKISLSLRDLVRTNLHAWQ